MCNGENLLNCIKHTLPEVINHNHGNRAAVCFPLYISSVCHSPNVSYIHPFIHSPRNGRYSTCLVAAAASIIWTVKDQSACFGRRKHTLQSRFKDSNSNHEGRQAGHRKTSRPDIQLPWHLEKKAFWCGRQNETVFVFLSISVAANLPIAFFFLSLSASHCMSVFLSVSFIISLLFLLCLLLVSSDPPPTQVYIFMFQHAWNKCIYIYVNVSCFYTDISVLHCCLQWVEQLFTDPLTSLSEGYHSKAWCVSHWARRHRPFLHQLSSVP